MGECDKREEMFDLMLKKIGVSINEIFDDCGDSDDFDFVLDLCLATLVSHLRVCKGLVAWLELAKPGGDHEKLLRKLFYLMSASASEMVSGCGNLGDKDKINGRLSDIFLDS